MYDLASLFGQTLQPVKPAFIVAEISANHNQSLERAEAIIRAAADAGADAIKLQTYTADTMTIASRQEYFKIHGTIWEGKQLYDLYLEAYTPWEWHRKLFEIAGGLGMLSFSTPFDATAVDFLESLNVPCHKVASFELVDMPLLKKIAATGKPVIVSTGMAGLAEIEEAVLTLREGGVSQMALLHCSSSYPADPAEINLATIPHLSATFRCPAGLSDHTPGATVAVAAVAMGARIIEKHFTLARTDGGPDSAFSMEPHEFKQMVQDIRTVEKASGSVHYGPTSSERASLAFRRSLFVVEDMRKGEIFTEKNVRSIRPSNGLHTRHWQDVLGKAASCDIAKGTPLAWGLIS